MAAIFFFFEFTYEDFLQELPFFPNPKNDSELLINLQYAFLVKGDKKAQAELWIRSIEIAKKLIRKEREQNGFYLEDLEDKAHSAVEYVLRRYNKRIDNYCWSVRKNFVSAIYGGVRHALYYRSKSDALYENLKKYKSSAQALVNPYSGEMYGAYKE